MLLLLIRFGIFFQCVKLPHSIISEHELFLVGALQKSSLKALDDNQTILVSKDMKSPAGALTGKARKRRSKLDKPEEEALTAVFNEKTAKSASAFSFSGGLLALWIAICLASFFLGSWLPQRISI